MYFLTKENRYKNFNLKSSRITVVKCVKIKFISYNIKNRFYQGYKSQHSLKRD